MRPARAVPLVIYPDATQPLRRSPGRDARDRVAAVACVRVGLRGAPLHHAAGDRPPAGRAQAVLPAASRRSRHARRRPGSLAERRLGGRSQSFRRTSARRSSDRFRSRRFPREQGAALEKFGMAALKRLGTLPWRAAEEFGNLRRAFEGFKRGSQRTAPATRCCLPRSASHYLQDAHQPFHASNNYDGQLTGQRGIHSRFERDLVEKFEARLTVAPAAPRAVPRLATPPSTRCSPATSWWIRCCGPIRKRSATGTHTTMSTSRHFS